MIAIPIKNLESVAAVLACAALTFVFSRFGRLNSALLSGSGVFAATLLIARFHRRPFSRVALGALFSGLAAAGLAWAIRSVLGLAWEGVRAFAMSPLFPALITLALAVCSWIDVSRDERGPASSARDAPPSSP